MDFHVSRRRAAAALMMITLLAGCADDEPTTSQPQASEPQTVSTLPAMTTPDARDATETEIEPATDDRGADAADQEVDDGDAEVQVIEATITDGEVQTDNSRVDVALGTIVRLEVGADVNDEVHVHGYDLLAPVSPADPAVIEFAADIPGAFEVEAEDSGVELLQLRVR